MKSFKDKQAASRQRCYSSHIRSDPTLNSHIEYSFSYRNPKARVLLLFPQKVIENISSQYVSAIVGNDEKNTKLASILGCTGM